MLTLDTVPERQINWLWHPYIPYGAATMLFGPGGVGKSHITVDLAARVTRGEPFPLAERARRTRPLPVLIMSAEDEADAVLVPRLRKADADLSLIHAPTEPFTLDLEGLAAVERYISASSAALVIIDPIVAYLGGKVDMHRANEVRPIIGGLHQLAMRTQTAILIVHHARKGAAERSGNDDWERAMGSADFVNAVRSGLFVNRGNTGDEKTFKHVKSNYAKEGPPLSFTFGDHGLEWLGIADTGEPGTGSDPGATRASNKTSQAKAFLRATLAAGPVPALEVQQAAIDNGFSPATLNRAKVGIVESFAVRSPTTGALQWHWRLRPPDAPASNLPVSPE